MPWEVSKLLLQVQWVPRDAGEVTDDYDDDVDVVGAATAAADEDAVCRPIFIIYQIS